MFALSFLRYTSWYLRNTHIHTMFSPFPTTYPKISTIYQEINTWEKFLFFGTCGSDKLTWVIFPTPPRLFGPVIKTYFKTCRGIEVILTQILALARHLITAFFFQYPSPISGVIKYYYNLANESELPRS